MASRRTSSRRNAQPEAEYELEENTPPPPRRTSRHSASHTAEVVYGDEGPSFMGRWITSIAGICMSWLIYDVVLWDSLGASCQAFLADSDIATWQHYATAASGAVIIAIVAGIFSAALFKSKVGNFFAGLSIFAVGTLVMNCVHVLQPLPALDKNDSLQAAGAILHMSLLPTLTSFEQERTSLQSEVETAQQNLAEAQKKINDIESENMNLMETNTNNIAALEKNAEEKETLQKQIQEQTVLSNDLKTQLEEARKEAAAVHATLKATEEKLAQQEAIQHKLSETINDMEKQLVAASDKANNLNQEIVRLKKELQRQKDMEAMKKMGTTPDQPPKAPGVE